MHNVILAFLLALTMPILALAQQSASSNRLERVLNLAPPDSAKNVFSVSGTVVSAVTGQPVEGALVRLELTRQGAVLAMLQDSALANIAPVLTGSDGRFLFRQVGEASYDLRVSKRRYWPIEQAQNANGTPLVVRATAPLDQFLIRLFPAASIEGRVTNSAGIPLPGVGLELFDMNQTASKRIGETMSADDGSYYFDGLRPGRYFVQSKSFANETAFASAVAISSEEARPLDVSMIASRGYTVSGQLMVADGSQDGVLSSRLTIRRLFIDDQETQTFDGLVFSAEALQPGLYRFSARTERIAGEASCGLVEILVSNSDVEAVRIPMTTCFVVEVQGR
jgi:hypothetical protein